jgi:hypothetical protein
VKRIGLIGAALLSQDIPLHALAAVDAALV